MTTRREFTKQLPLDFAARETPAGSPFQVGETPHCYRVTRPVTDDEVIAFSREILAARVARTTFFQSVEDTKNYFVLQLSTRLHEVFACAFLDNRHALLAYEELFFGTIDSCSVHPREVVRRALHHNAAAVVFAHNHPAGTPEPSRADEQITYRLKEALAFVDVRVLDHLVVGGAQVTSFAARGLL
jgi:DNA repair protein RadC